LRVLAASKMFQLHSLPVAVCACVLWLNFSIIMQATDERNQRLDEIFALNSCIAGPFDKRKQFEWLNVEIVRLTSNGPANRLLYLVLLPALTTVSRLTPNSLA
jgi:hypothetical protein